MKTFNSKSPEASAYGSHYFKDIDRRSFMQALSASALATAGASAPSFAAATVANPQATADSCILLWMGGGMAAPETFDPKRYVPFDIGIPAESIISTFPAIDTAVDSIKICEGLENIAQVMDRATLIRSHYVADLGHILHSRHQYHWHTGYVPPQTVAAPHMGAWMARMLGPRNSVIPAFINIGQRLEGFGESDEVKAFTTAGFLGSEFGPFNIPYPKEANTVVRPPKGMTPVRFERRNKLYREMIKRSPMGEYASEFHQESMLRSMENAYRLLSSPERKAFDLENEPRESYEQYNTGRFGLGCLLARRLTESGARFIEVSTEYEPFLRWDTHENGHTTAKTMKEQIDRPIAQLIVDLEQRGLLERTLVVIASEFSRDMMIEGVPGSTAKDQSRAKADVMQEMKQYGLHRHFTGSCSVVMFGGGTKQGFLYGETADERPCLVTKNPVSVDDMLATIYSAMGILPSAAVEIEKRPFYITKDGKGKPVTELFA